MGLGNGLRINLLEDSRVVTRDGERPRTFFIVSSQTKFSTVPPRLRSDLMRMPLSVSKVQFFTKTFFTPPTVSLPDAHAVTML